MVRQGWPAHSGDFWCALCVCCLGLRPAAVCAEEAALSADPAIAYWREDSAAMRSIVGYVAEVTDEGSAGYVPPCDRIAVFDFDGTLYGELFPTYFDHCLLVHRVLHDDTCHAPEETRAYAAALEQAMLTRGPEPDSDKSTAQYAAEVFQGMTVEEYRAYVRAFLSTPAVGFEGMTYGEGFYRPMVALVQYLSERGFTVFISSGSERNLVRELIEGKLDRWVPSHCVIGSTFSLMATGQGEKAGRSYTLTPEDEVLMEGNLVVKNQKLNKVFSIVDEIGKTPILVFGNSSGDLAMAQYALNTSSYAARAYMLLCDDTERDYGSLAVAEAFAEVCRKSGFETVSMRDDFATIYGGNVTKTAAPEEQPLDDAA